MPDRRKREEPQSSWKMLALREVMQEEDASERREEKELRRHAETLEGLEMQSLRARERESVSLNKKDRRRKGGDADYCPRASAWRKPEKTLSELLWAELSRPQKTRGGDRGEKKRGIDGDICSCKHGGGQVGTHSLPGENKRGQAPIAMGGKQPI